MAEPSGSLWTNGRRLTPSECLWLAVLDQACADAGSVNLRVRSQALEWWAGDMPGVLSRALDIPLSRLERLRVARGGLRMTAEHGNKGRRLGVRVVQKDQYQYGRDRRRVLFEKDPNGTNWASTRTLATVGDFLNDREPEPSEIAAPGLQPLGRPRQPSWRRVAAV